MRIVRNSRTERLLDFIKPSLGESEGLHMFRPRLSLFGLAELMPELFRLKRARLVLRAFEQPTELLGTAVDRPFRNRLQARWLAKRLQEWARKCAQIRNAQSQIPQGAMVVRDTYGGSSQAFLGSLAFTTDGLGIPPGNPLSLIQLAENDEDRKLLTEWFESQWASVPKNSTNREKFFAALDSLASPVTPMQVYAQMLHHVFALRDDSLDGK